VRGAQHDPLAVRGVYCGSSRAVAQSGSAQQWGCWGREFKSPPPDLRSIAARGPIEARPAVPQAPARIRRDMSGHAAPPASVAVAKTQGGRWAAVGLLATCMFVVGTSELVITGILPVIAQDLNTPIATAGYLVAAYALSFAVVTPIVAAVTPSVDRRRMLLACLAGFVAGSGVGAGGGGFCGGLVGGGGVAGAGGAA